jgi:hypothetical protein
MDAGRRRRTEAATRLRRASGAAAARGGRRKSRRRVRGLARVSSGCFLTLLGRHTWTPTGPTRQAQVGLQVGVQVGSVPPTDRWAPENAAHLSLTFRL